MTHGPVADLAGFYLPWLAAAAASAHMPGAADVLLIRIDGYEVPVLQLVLGLAGVLMARPLAPRREPPLGLLKQVLVTVIMLIATAAWVADSRPGVLFTFVVSIGLGFSGYALIELAGREIEAFVKRIFSAATGLLDSLPGKKK